MLKGLIMAYIVSYLKVIDQYTTYTLSGPDQGQGADQCTELCTIDGVTYASVPDGVTLPTQSAEIAESVQLVEITDSLRDRIKLESPHVALISSRMVDTIRSAYSIDDEMYFARIGVGAATGLYTPGPGELEEMAVFGNFVEGVREWGRNERAKLGL
jgi:hypothetical protein